MVYKVVLLYQNCQHLLESGYQEQIINNLQPAVRESVRVVEEAKESKMKNHRFAFVKLCFGFFNENYISLLWNSKTWVLYFCSVMLFLLGSLCQTSSTIAPSYDLTAMNWSPLPASALQKKSARSHTQTFIFIQ